MPSNAWASHLEGLLADPEDLIRLCRLVLDEAGGRPKIGSASRATVVLCVSAWEAYIEELVRESLEVLRPPTPPLGLWPALNATIRGQLGRFHTPNAENVRTLLSDALGLSNIQHSWRWRSCTPEQAVQRLTAVMEQRHEIAHGVNPRPAVVFDYSSRLPLFFRRLARCTDAVRGHLVTVHGITHPWPA
jgi:HEPN superfamily RiboL-PSP-like protein